MPCPLLIVSQSDSLIQIIDINSYTGWQTVQIQISWLLQKPTDLDLHCLQRQGISRFSRIRIINKYTSLQYIYWILLQEVNRLKNEMVAMEKAVVERMGYLQRYKVRYRDSITSRGGEGEGAVVIMNTWYFVESLNQFFRPESLYMFHLLFDSALLARKKNDSLLLQLNGRL